VLGRNVDEAKRKIGETSRNIMLQIEIYFRFRSYRELFKLTTLKIDIA